MSAFRVLVTGSRSWRLAAVIRHELDQVSAEHGPLTVVHGAASGADALAAAYAKRCGWEVESHPADWTGPCRPTCLPGHRVDRRNGTTYCPAAGVYRNAAMVASGPDLVLAFIRAHSAGASGCAGVAERAGIEVRRVYDCACHTPAGGVRARRTAGVSS